MWVGPMKASASLLQGSGEELHRPLPLPTLAQLPPSQALQRRPTGPNLWQSCLGSHKTSNQKTSIKQPPPKRPLHCFWEVLPGTFILTPDFPQLVCDYTCKVCLLDCDCGSPKKSPGEPSEDPGVSPCLHFVLHCPSLTPSPLPFSSRSPLVCWAELPGF